MILPPAPEEPEAEPQDDNTPPISDWDMEAYVQKANKVEAARRAEHKADTDRWHGLTKNKPAEVPSSSPSGAAHSEGLSFSDRGKPYDPMTDQ